MNPLKSLVAMSTITIISRILGFVRDTMIARAFGAGMMTDAFFIAFKFPNLLRRFFAEGAFYQVFLPFLSEYRHHASMEELRVFIAHVFGLLIVVLMIIVFFGVLIAPWIVMVTAPGIGFFGEKFSITVKIFRIMFPYILFVSLTSLMSAILNVWNFLLVPIYTPIFLNISIIIFSIFTESLYFKIPIIGLAWSVIIGGILQCMYCIPFLQAINMLVIPKINFKDSKIFKICQEMGPAFIAVSGTQLSLIINTILASFLQDGSISWIYYADRLVELPVGVFGVTLSTILLSCLSRSVYSKNNGDYCYLMNWGIKLCCVLSFPSAVILGILSKPLIITIFQYGKFSEFDVLMTQYSLIFYAIGLPGLILVKVLVSGFYAIRNFKAPIKILMITVVFSQCINLICIHLLQHTVFACSISIGAWLNAGLLYWKLRKQYFFRLQFSWWVFLCQLMISLIVTYCICLGILIMVADWTSGSILYRLFRMTGALIICGSGYMITLWCVGLRIKDFVFYNK